jgi:polar amino acid transport system substrate-binding protein
MNRNIVMKKFIYLIATFVFIAPLCAEMTPNDISYYTEDYPPYNFKQNGKASGFATEILLQMFKILNVKKTVDDISVVPWARGYNDVQRKRNVCLFCMTKTAERVEKHGFRWVGPVIGTNSVIFARKKKKFIINNVSDIFKYRVCAIREDVAEQTIVSLGYSFDNVDRTSHPVSIIKKLLSDRCSLWAYGSIAGQWVLKKNNYNPDDFEIVYNLTQKQYLYYAFNSQTPDSVVIPLQKAFDKLKANGVVDKKISKYLK